MATIDELGIGRKVTAAVNGQQKEGVVVGKRVCTATAGLEWEVRKRTLINIDRGIVR